MNRGVVIFNTKIRPVDSRSQCSDADRSFKQKLTPLLDCALLIVAESNGIYSFFDHFCYHR